MTHLTKSDPQTSPYWPQAGRLWVHFYTGQFILGALGRYFFARHILMRAVYSGTGDGDGGRDDYEDDGDDDVAFLCWAHYTGGGWASE